MKEKGTTGCKVVSTGTSHRTWWQSRPNNHCHSDTRQHVTTQRARHRLNAGPTSEKLAQHWAYASPSVWISLDIQSFTRGSRPFPLVYLIVFCFYWWRLGQPTLFPHYLSGHCGRWFTNPLRLESQIYLCDSMQYFIIMSRMAHLEMRNIGENTVCVLFYNMPMSHTIYRSLKRRNG